MRSRSQLIAGNLFLAIAAILLLWQASPDRLPTGLALATPWTVSGAAILAVGRTGALLGALVATVSLMAAGWIFTLANGGQGREIAASLFASREGFFSWADVAIISAGLALLFVVALALAAMALARPQAVEE
jgi:hypothetical protein